MPNDSSDLEDAHNKGQADGSSGEYRPPVPINIIDEFTTPQETLDSWRELNEKYDEGWNNANDQR
jgi:hypothetical protein